MMRSMLRCLQVAAIWPVLIAGCNTCPTQCNSCCPPVTNCCPTNQTACAQPCGGGCSTSSCCEHEKFKLPSLFHSCKSDCCASACKPACETACKPACEVKPATCTAACQPNKHCCQGGASPYSPCFATAPIIDFSGLLPAKDKCCQPANACKACASCTPVAVPTAQHNCTTCNKVVSEGQGCGTCGKAHWSTRQAGCTSSCPPPKPSCGCHSSFSSTTPAVVQPAPVPAAAAAMLNSNVGQATEEAKPEVVQQEPILETPPAAVAENVVVAQPQQTTSMKPATAEGRPFAAIAAELPKQYHSEDYRVLVGELDFNQQTNTWRLRFSPIDREDFYGGVVTLRGVGSEFGDLRPGATVAVRGQLADASDRGLSPDFRIADFHLLVP